MKLRWKLALFVVVILLGGVLWLFRTDDRPQRELEKTRRDLQKAGFKVDLSEFDFSTPSDQQLCEKALIQADLIGATMRGSPDYPILREFDFRPEVGSNTAIVVWRPATLEMEFQDDWLTLHETMEANRTQLDAAVDAVRSGRVAFNLNAAQGSGMLLRHAPMLKNLVRIFGVRSMLALRDGENDAAWTNLNVATRLVTAYDVEPAEISHMVRMSCAAIAIEVTWQALQSTNWTDDQLLSLQREWESIDFFKDFPETVAFSRAGFAASCELERQQPPSAGLTFKQALQSPQMAWYELKSAWQQARFRNYGSYEQEKDLLIHYRDRELEWRRAIQCSTWREMRQLPGVTNIVPFVSQAGPSLTTTLMSLKQTAMGFQSGGSTLGRAAKAEARRRLVITAIALERYRLANGSYANSLQELVPRFLKATPVDFMDGNALRYRLINNHFLLYSVDVDGKDDGGRMIRAEYAIPHETFDPGDLVWPLPASQEEADLSQSTERKREQELADEQSLDQATWQWSRTAKRQTQIDKLLAANPPIVPEDTRFNGRPLIDFLRNERAPQRAATLQEMLTLHPVVTGAEPEIITFEVPVRYAALPNPEVFTLVVDFWEGEDSDDGCSAVMYECKPATNGNCLIEWQAGFETPGPHVLQAAIHMWDEQAEAWVFSEGPLLPFYSSNLCQFSRSSAYFDPSLGATLYAKVPESNAVYTVDFMSMKGEQVWQTEGTTTNGVIKVHWDLNDKQGRHYSNETFSTVFHVTLPNSGISQSQRGP